MSQCDKCKKVTDSRERNSLRCFGKCKKVFHYTCIDWNFEKFSKLFKDCPYARFVCLECQNHDEDTIYEEFKKINNFVEELKQHLCANHTKLNVQLGEIKEHVVDMQKPKETSSFASVVKSNPTKVVLLQPKKPQQSKKTREDVVSLIDPKSIPVMGCRNVANGGIILQCNSNEAKEKLKQIASDKLGADYEIKLPTELNPRVKILGMSEKLESEEIISALKQQNPFLSEGTIKVVTTYNRRNTQKIDTIIEVDADNFKKIIAAEKLNINFDRCQVVESIGITRCYNCNGYSHHGMKCTSQLTCPKCSGNHRFSDCKSTEMKCSNCTDANNKLHLKINTNHATWDNSCTIYQRKLKSLKNQINYQ